MEDRRIKVSYLSGKIKYTIVVYRHHVCKKWYFQVTINKQPGVPRNHSGKTVAAATKKTADKSRVNALLRGYEAADRFEETKTRIENAKLTDIEARTFTD